MSEVQNQLARYFDAQVEYLPTADVFAANTRDFGMLYARKIKPVALGTSVPNMVIVPTGNVYHYLKDHCQKDGLDEYCEQMFMRLFDCVYLDGRFGRERRQDMIDELGRDLYQDCLPVGEHNPVLAYRIVSTLRAAAAELSAHLRREGLYFNDTLIYDYVRRTDPRHALLQRKSHAVFL
jgi:hypothetical protein